MKALVCAAALAAGLATAAAQNVYSLNVVGYYNIPLAANAKVMIANQLNTTNNTLAALFPDGPALATVFKYGGGFTSYTFDDLDMEWLPDGNATLNPGEGAFFLSPVATTLTFVGEVLQGNLQNTLPLGQKVIRSSMVPQAGLITTDLGLPAEALDSLFTYAGGYSSYIFDDLDMEWLPSEPNIAVGQSFFYIKAAGNASSTWTRNFTVQ
ncbi:MAG TPA: hypothetical protein PLN97_13100 [Verrucomicrobiota bacterium]|jgi:hypothetical protein|nr:hypothetical protein [Verrucomicrobiota bacterium]OQC23756.1 MAG: hypothetical protein BWX68_02626 [Verrucomicrobia bacterium ADurb.Bin063]HRY59693.1 hypothetical protein [Candidatus Paceibacterota bacterium]HNR72528.1 hypothetical protein [Verrucomicrobiota bacterium]HOF72254.1 hypothetical protein [Verrucomicrobiota bacterium]